MTQAVQCEHVGPWRGQGVRAFEPSAATLRTLARACLRWLWYPVRYRLYNYLFLSFSPQLYNITIHQFYFPINHFKVLHFAVQLSWYKLVLLGERKWCYECRYQMAG